MPNHLRDAHYQGAKSLGHGAGYDYPHDHAEGWVDQQYRPAELEGRVYYEPSAHGHEREVVELMADRRPGKRRSAAADRPPDDRGGAS